MSTDPTMVTGDLDWQDPTVRAARRRLRDAVDEVKAAARALGIEVPADRYTPWRVRAEAWLWRAHDLLHHHREVRR